MIDFFKSNNPGVVLFYGIYLILFRVCLLFGERDTGFVFEHNEPLSHLVFGWLGQFNVNQTYFLALLAVPVVFVQSLFVNQIVNQQRMTTRKSFLGGLLFIIFVSFFSEGLFFSPVLIALTFIILLCDKIFQLNKNEKLYPIIFDAGFYTAVAILFYFPVIVLVPFIFIGLGNLRSFSYRNSIILFLGLITPFFIAFSFYFWQDKLSMWWFHIANMGNHGIFNGFKITTLQWWQIGFYATLAVLHMVLVPNIIYSSLIQVRKLVTLLIILILLLIAGIFLQQNAGMAYFMLFAFPLSIFSTMVLLEIKKKWIAEVYHIILISLLLAGQYIPLFAFKI